MMPIHGTLNGLAEKVRFVPLVMRKLGIVPNVLVIFMSERIWDINPHTMFLPRKNLNLVMVGKIKIGSATKKGWGGFNDKMDSIWWPLSSSM